VRLLPHYEKAVIPIEKLRDYALDPGHPEGKHKARVFKAALGIEQAHAEVFAQILKRTLYRSPAAPGIKNQYGSRWTTFHETIGLDGKSEVVTAVWIYRPEQVDVPVLISCYIEPDGSRRLEEAQKAGLDL